MDSNCKNKFNLDHVYCHPNDGGYIRANSGATDILTLLKENKQLKAMLLLHLDLIQEQSDQLMAKDKMLSTLKEENEALKSRVEKMERRLQLKYSKSPDTTLMSNQIEIKNENVPIVGCGEPVVPPVDSALAHVSGVTSSESKYKICDENNYASDSIIGESNGKFISKIILQRVQITGDVSVKHEVETDAFSQQENHDERFPTKELRSKCESAIQNDTEDSFSCGSGDQDQILGRLGRSRKRKRYAVLTTDTMYAAREWEDQKIDEETNKEEAEALKAEEPNLEIPKWTIKEFTGLYSIEGTEDLSDEVFLKRHAKLEYDEKRRKKWDVQRIREQRTIERLKRRHCKEEMQDSDNNQETTSFYPSHDSIKFIQIVEELPVQAFGECVPRLAPKEFNPTLQTVPGTNSTEVAEFQPSYLAFLKKRRRQQSISSGTKRIHRRSVKN